MRSYLSRAIQKLKPNSEYVMQSNDYSTIKWVVLEGEAPTHAQIDAAIEEVKADESAAEVKAEADKMAAQAKLAALGLTADDLKALGL